MAEPVFEHKHQDGDYIVDIKIYKVPKDRYHPEGFKYSLVLIKSGKRILGYDNHERRGHHIHRGNRELPYKFIDEWKLMQDFQSDVDMSETYHQSNGLMDKVQFPLWIGYVSEHAQEPPAGYATSL